MQDVLAGGAGVLLILHGLIHLMGTTVYMKLGTIESLPYKTTLLGGRLDLGERGIRAFGALWTLPAAGFVLGGVALIAGWAGWRIPVTASAVFSLALTLLDRSVAYAGAVLNVLILAAVWAAPIVAARLGA